MSEIHVDATSWKGLWEELAIGPSGGQASSKLVRRSDGSIARAFLKILNRQTDPERRARVYREVASLETVHLVGIPRLIETNARFYDNARYQLYLVTEFIMERISENLRGSYRLLRQLMLQFSFAIS